MRFKLLKSNSLRDVCASSNYTTGELAGHASTTPGRLGCTAMDIVRNRRLQSDFHPVYFGRTLSRPKSATNKTRKTRRNFPMKTLLRTTIIGLLVCAGYAAVATDINVPHNGAALPGPCQPATGRPGGS